MPISDGTALLSPTAVAQALAQDSTIPFIPFVKITAGSTVYRYCANTESITRMDGVYLPGDFQITFAEDTDSAASTVQITVGLVDREACDLVMAYNGTVTVEAFVCLADTPDIVEHGGTFVLKDASHDSTTLRGTLGFEEAIYMQAFPKRRMTPSSHPGYFV